MLFKDLKDCPYFRFMQIRNTIYYNVQMASTLFPNDPDTKIAVYYMGDEITCISHEIGSDRISIRYRDGEQEADRNIDYDMDLSVDCWKQITIAVL